MITKRIIPCLDIDKGRVVKGTNFVDIKDAGDPVELAKKYADDGADELVFLDITASSDKRNILTTMVERVAREIFIPFTVGGGIHSIEMIQHILDLGADKVSLNTAALYNPSFVQAAADHFGSQCIVVAVDIKRIQTKPAALFSKDPVYSQLRSNRHSICEVYSHGGRKNCGIDALKWIKYCQELGAGEVLLTSMDRDGTQSGYDLEMLSAVKSLVQIPVIASGGAGSIDDIVSGLKYADAALLASLLHFGKLTIPELKHSLQSNSIPMR